MAQKIEPIHTSCKKCVFATYENITQIGCAMHLIEKYKEKTIEVLEAYDEDKEFYVINNKKCHGYREDSWFKGIGMSMDEKIEIVKKSNRLDYLAVINLKNFTNLNNLIEIIEEIKKVDILPSKLILIRYSGDDKQFIFEDIKPMIENLGIPWRLQTMIDSTLGWNDIVYQISSQNMKYRFICLINGISKNLNALINRANSIVYDELDNFKILCDSDKKQNILYCGAVYRYAAAHGANILDDINYYQYL